MKRHLPFRLELPNYYAYQLRMNNIDLTSQQKAHFIHCVGRIYEKSEHVIFRGDKKDSLKRVYGISGRWSPTVFNREFFFFGPKSRLFMLSAAQRERALNITTNCNDDFSRIFRMIRELLLTPGSRELREKIDKLTRKNGPLVTYFLQADNEDMFLQVLRTLPEPLRRKMSDQYLSLLHHLGAGVYYNETFMLSTTESLAKARKFAYGNQHGHPNPIAQEQAIVIAGWVPIGLDIAVKTAHFLDLRTHRKIEEIGLPHYYPLFPHEHEITLKGGLLPHLILGYLHWEDGAEVFEVNPAVFLVGENWDGVQLPIDQSSWETRILSTEFGAYFNLRDSQVFSQHEVHK